MVLDILYALDKTGAIRYFKVSTEANNIHTETGLLGTSSPVRRTKTVLNGKNIGKKNETNPTTQAEFEAQGLWNDKLNEGYKSVIMLIDRLSMMCKDDEVEVGSPNIETIFQLAEIKYNTSSTWTPLPMLAEKYKDHSHKVVFPIITQPKLNGCRCLALWDHDINDIVLEGRGGERFEIQYIKDAVAPILAQRQNIVLDGELFRHGKHLQEISGACRKKKNAPDWLEYHIYDCFIPSAPAMKQWLRLDFLGTTLKSYVKAQDSKIYYLGARRVSSHEELMEVHMENVSNGYEGTMGRQPNDPYSPGFRVTSLLKVKDYIDEEFTLIDCQAQDANRIGETFIFILRDNKNSEIQFGARPTGTINEKLIWYNNKEKWIGSTVTVRFQERSKDGVPLQGHVVHTDSEILCSILKE